LHRTSDFARTRHAPIVARLLLALVLLASGLAPLLQTSGDPLSSSSTGSVVGAKGKDKHTGDARGKRPDRPDRQTGRGEDHRQAGTQRDGGLKGAPPELDAAAIASENAESVAGLECGEFDAVRTDDRVYCTHGEDPPVIAGDPDAEGAAMPRSVPSVLCLDDGVSGPRVQLVYVRRNDRPSRYAELQPNFRRFAAEMDLIFNQSARKTGGTLRVRYVTDANCQVDVQELVVAPPSLDRFGTLIQKMESAGYDELDRKYLMLVDERIFCGVATYAGGRHADKPNSQSHDFTGYARVDIPCWDAGSMAHELSHTLGAVQLSAPNTSGGGHCIDEWDVLCYSDQPFKPRMRTICEDGTQDFRLDCGNDDYFAANPAAGSYLSRHWNLARSRYLTDGPEIACADAAHEPDDAYWYWFWDVPMRKFEVGASEQHAFCQEPGDTDWIRFDGKAGVSYQIETTALAPGVDTRLVLYRGFVEQGWREMDQFAVNDNRAEGDLSSAIVFTAPSEGSYLVGVSDAGNEVGPEQTYTLSVWESASPGSFHLSISRTRGKPKSTFALTARGLAPGGTLKVWWEGQDKSRPLGELTAGADGSASAVYRVPDNADSRIYQVEAVSSDGRAASADFRVLSASGKGDGKAKGQDKNRGKAKQRGKGKKRGRRNR
jgi:hypothetical protein